MGTLCGCWGHVGWRACFPLLPLAQLHRQSTCAILGCPEQEGSVPSLPNPHHGVPTKLQQSPGPLPTEWILHPQCLPDAPGRPNKRGWVSSLSRGCAGAATGRSEGSWLLRATEGHYCLRQAGTRTAPLSVPVGLALGHIPRAQGHGDTRLQCDLSSHRTTEPLELRPLSRESGEAT